MLKTVLCKHVIVLCESKYWVSMLLSLRFGPNHNGKQEVDRSGYWDMSDHVVDIGIDIEPCYEQRYANADLSLSTTTQQYQHQ